MIWVPRFVQRHLENRGLSEMSVAFGLVAAASFLVVMLLGVLFEKAYGHTGVSVFRACFGAWLVFMGWFWIALVSVGRQAPVKRHSTGELTVLQVTCALIVGLQFLFASPKDRPMVQEFGQVFELAIIGFHCVYFTLAWGSGVKVPFRSYLAFFAMVGLVVISSKYG